MAEPTRMNPDPAALKVAILDFDGTLAFLATDYALVRSRLRELFASHGFDREFGPILETIEEGVTELVPKLGRNRALTVRRQAHAIIAEEEIAGAAQATPLPHAREFVDDLLAASVGVGIVTRNHGACVRPVLERLGFPEVGLLVCRDDVVRAKPDPEGGKRVLRHFGAKGHEAVVVGDTYHDVRLGHVLKARTMLIEHPGTRPVVDEPTWRVKGLDEARAILRPLLQR